MNQEMILILDFGGCLARNKRLSEVLSEISKISSSLSAYETY